MEEVRALPIIVGGFYRSGTTLVRRLLDAHSCIHCGPEVKFFKDLRGDYLDDPLGHVRLFSTLPSLGLDEGEILGIFGRAFVEAHELAARKVGKARWADKNPENVLHLQQWQQLLPKGFFFIHVVRHPLDALSSLKEVKFPLAVPSEWEEKVILYRRYRETGDAYILRNTPRSFVIQYESLVTNPNETVRQIFRVLGERYEPEVLDNYCAPQRGYGIEDPKVARTTAIHRGSVGRWERDLDENEVNKAKQLLPAAWFE